MIDVPQTPRRPNPNRRAIHATCRTHGGCIGFTNLVVTKRDGVIELDPHVPGQCVLTLAEDEATALRDALIEHGPSTVTDPTAIDPCPAGSPTQLCCNAALPYCAKGEPPPRADEPSTIRSSVRPAAGLDPVIHPPI